MNWLRPYLSVPFKALALLVRIFRFNRGWLAELLARKGAAGSMKGIVVLTVLAWFSIWLFANDDYRGKLNQAVKALWSEIGE